MHAVKTLVQTEEVRAGDVIPDWFDGKSARVTRVVPRFRETVMVHVVPLNKDDFIPSSRSYKYGRGIQVERKTERKD